MRAYHVCYETVEPYREFSVKQRRDNVSYDTFLSLQMRIILINTVTNLT